MIRTSSKRRPDGSIVVTIGRTKIILKTVSEFDAFMAGVKVAHLQLQAELLPLLSVKDGTDAIPEPRPRTAKTGAVHV